MVAGAYYTEWKVVSVTPCTVKVKEINFYSAYGSCRVFGVRKPNFNAAFLDGLFVHRDCLDHTRFVRPNMDEQRSIHEEFQKLNVQSAIPFSADQEIQYDQDKEKLVVFTEEKEASPAKRRRVE
jgi:hypothetical protein